MKKILDFFLYSVTGQNVGKAFWKKWQIKKDTFTSLHHKTNAF